jgi:geranylgeranyl reductase family protein
MARIDCDVVVAGAGPSGAAAAIHLSRAGFRVILADTRVFPRDKVCGDFVSPVALRELRDLGVAELPEYRSSHRIRSAAVHVDGEHLMTSAIPKAGRLAAHGRVIPRKALDEWIVRRAQTSGAELREGYRVEAFKALRDHINISVRHNGRPLTLRARVLIGADGSSSLIARLLRGRGVPDEDRIIAVRGYFEGVEGPPNRADIYFSNRIFPGYYWLFPTGRTSANVGVGLASGTFPPSGEHLRTVLVDLIQQDAALRERLGNARLVGDIVGWPLTTYDDTLPITGERVLLAGDAAGLINPLNGEGIQYALLSGRWAAEAVAHCAESNDFSADALAAYAARVSSELRYDMTVARTILQLIRNRGLNRLWLEAVKIIAARAAVDPDYAAITGGVLAGIVPVRRVASVDVIYRTIQQAAVTLGITALKEAMKGPAHLLRLGAAAAASAAETGATMVENRDASVKWGVGLAQSAIGLADEYRKDRRRRLAK